MELSKVCAVITGAGSGLGEATARHFSSMGAKVTILDRDSEKGEQVAHETKGHFINTDVTQEQSVSRAIQFAQDKMGKINVAINCAGIALGIKTLGKDGVHPLDSFQQTIDINLVGSFNVCRLAAQAMEENPDDGVNDRGVLINTASVAAFDGQKGQAAYSASKGGIVAMTLPMARDLARSRIRVMAIAPGIFQTPMMASMPQNVQDSLAANVPYPSRLGEPLEYAQLAAFIVQMQYLNAEVIRLDGALRMQ